jgi:hypothetical protein
MSYKSSLVQKLAGLASNLKERELEDLIEQMGKSQSKK